MKRPELQKIGCDDVILKDPQKWGGGSGAAEIVLCTRCMVQIAPGHRHLEIQLPEVQWTVF